MIRVLICGKSDVGFNRFKFLRKKMFFLCLFFKKSSITIVEKTYKTVFKFTMDVNKFDLKYFQVQNYEKELSKIFLYVKISSTSTVIPDIKI